MYKTQLVSFL